MNSIRKNRDYTDQTGPIDDDAESSVDRALEETLGRLHVGSTNKELEAALEDFATMARRLTPVQREIAKRGAVAGLTDAGVKSPTGMVSAALKPTTSDDVDDSKSGTQIVLADVEPCADAVDGFEMLEGIIASILKYIAMPFDYALTAALWSIFTHVHDAFWISPILAYQSPEKRCGKTLNLILQQALVTRPLMAANITAAALFRTVEHFQPCLLIDEADTFLRGKDDALRGILNSGHLRASAQIVRTAGDDFEPRIFSTWAPKAIACIRSLPDTLEDRSIILRLKRRAPGEKITEMRRDRIHHELEPLRRQIARWAKDNATALTADPDVPNKLNDRARDNWRPLLTIADAIGPDAGAMARNAALTISGGDMGEVPASEMLLADIRDLFARRDRLTSDEIVEALVKMEERPWPEWYRGGPMSKAAMARQLKRFDWTDEDGKTTPIRPKMIRIGDETVRGYKLDWFADAFARYLPPQPATPATPPENAEELPDADRNKPEPMLRFGKGETPAKTGRVAGVAVQLGGNGAGPGLETQGDDFWAAFEREAVLEAVSS